MKALVIAALIVVSAPAVARADYYVQSSTCTTYTVLQDAVDTGALTIYVKDVNTETTATDIWHNVTLSIANAPCVRGGGGTIQLAVGATTRVLDVDAGVTLTLDGVVVAGGDVIADDGGTIYLDLGSSLLMQSAALVTGGVASGRGGCIYADHALIVMNAGTSVSGCHSESDGGGVAIEGISTPGAYHILRLLNANNATASGGGAWIDAAPVCMYEAANNSAGLDGGAAYVTSASGAAWLGTFTKQTTNVANRDGGGVFITGSQATLDATSELTSNNATSNGGAIRATGGGTVYLDPGSEVDHNNAQGNGGGVHGDALATINLSATGDPIAIGDGEHTQGTCGNATGLVEIDNNRAGYDANVETSPIRDGGGVYLSNASLVGGPAKIDTNTASQHGGGVAAYASATVTVEDATILTNTATRGNGGGLLASSASVVDLDGCTVESNTTKLGGGGVSLVASPTVTIESSTLNGNSAGLGGGLGMNSGAQATITSTTINDNQAPIGGGVYVGNSSSLTMLTGTISSNNGDLGGGITADSATVTLGDSPDNGCPKGSRCVTMASNTAAGLVGRGGAVLLMGSTTLVQVRRSVLNGNLADAGGAFWMDGSGHTLYLHNSAIVDNHGNTGFVSAIAAQAGTLTMFHDTVAYNDSGMNLTSSTSTAMSNSLVIQNTNRDIGGLGSGATVSGDCNGVQSATTQAAIAGTDNAATTPATASVTSSNGAPVNTADIVDQCTVLLNLDLLGRGRPAGSLADRGAYEVP